MANQPEVNLMKKSIPAQAIVTPNSLLYVVKANNKELNDRLLQLEGKLKEKYEQLSGNSSDIGVGSDKDINPAGTLPAMIVDTERALSTADRINSILTDLDEFI